MVCGADAGEGDAPERHLQSPLSSIKSLFWVLSVVVGMCQAVSCRAHSLPKPRRGATADPGPELTATQREQAAVSRRQQEELQDRIERGVQVIENLGSGPG